MLGIPDFDSSASLPSGSPYSETIRSARSAGSGTKNALCGHRSGTPGIRFGKSPSTHLNGLCQQARFSISESGCPSGSGNGKHVLQVAVGRLREHRLVSGLRVQDYLFIALGRHRARGESAIIIPVKRLNSK